MWCTESESGKRCRKGGESVAERQLARRRAHLYEISERGVVSYEDGRRLELGHDVLEDGGSNGLSIAGRRSSTKLVENDL